MKDDVMKLILRCIVPLFCLAVIGCQQRPLLTATHRQVAEPGGRPFQVKTNIDFLVDGVPSPLLIEMEMFIAYNPKYDTDFDVYGQLARSMVQQSLEEKLPRRLEKSKQGLPILRRDKVLELLWEEKDLIADRISPPYGEGIRFVVITIRGT